jgi:SAM-dependent methyltransferase
MSIIKKYDNLDFIICSDIFQFISPYPNLQYAFNNLYKILKPNGFVIFSVPFIYGQHNEYYPNLYDYNYPTLDSSDNVITVLPIPYEYTPAKSILLQQIIYDMYVNHQIDYKNIFYDITIGRDGIYTTNEGFDIPTGLGVFDCEKLSNYIETYVANN